jgi:AcrR family transcriptional regulator
MSGGQSEAETGVRRRPKDRKAQIARASAAAFGSQGYHAVSMGDIAARVGITPAALYRHSPSKYDLFRDAVLGLGQVLVDATAFADDEPDDSDPRDLTQAVVGALVDVTVANRTAGGLYRWQTRCLREPDRTALFEQLKRVNLRLARPLARMRPTLSPADRWTLSAAVLSVIGSITDHSTPLAANEIRKCFAAMAADLLETMLPGAHQSARPPTPLKIGSAAGIYEHVLYESMRLFRRRGYRDSSMEDIASAVGIQASGLYRSFPGKADILGLAYRRCADQHSGDLAEIVSTTTEPEAALARLVARYVARAVEHPDLATVYYTERRNLAESDLWVVDTIEQSMVDSWARLLTAVRPDMRMGSARYAVRAAFALSVDLRRLAGLDTRPNPSDTMRRLMEVALLARPAASAGGRGRAVQKASSKSR